MYFKPHDYQKRCIERVLNTKDLGLFLDMGLGKTVITLMAIKELKYNRFLVNKVLIIAPKKVAEGTWQKECKKWDQLSGLRISTVLGTQKQRMKALSINADIYIINRDNVVWLVDYYEHKWPFDMVVADEFSSFKSHKAKRFKALARIKPHIKRFVGLTGTPIPKGYLDLWAQVYLLDGGDRLGARFSQYRERYFDAGRRNGYVVFDYTMKQGAEKSILKKISDICISIKAEDYLELPDITYNEIPVILTPKARKDYDDLEKKMVLETIEGNVIDVTNAAALSNKLQQLSNGAVYDESHNYHEIHDCKIESFMEVVEQVNGKPLLVFYNFKHDKARLLQVLQKTKLKVRLLQTTEDEDDWNNGEIDVLLTHPASSAYGLNLQEGGNHIIWFGLGWNHELYAQANKRLHRQGQKEKVIIHHLITKDSRDEDVMRSLEMKGDVQENLLQSLKARIRKYKEIA